MKCYNCDQDMPENERFCTSCGAKAIDNNTSSQSRGFLELVRKMFRALMSFIFIAFIVFCTIIGGVIAYPDSKWDTNYTFLGIVIGLIVGVLIVIFVGGYIATIIEIGESVKALHKDITKITKPNKL